MGADQLHHLKAAGGGASFLRPRMAAAYALFVTGHVFFATLTRGLPNVFEGAAAGVAAGNSTIAPPQQLESQGRGPCRPHAVFTTFVCPSPTCTPLRERIENNTRHVWSHMRDVEFREMAPSEVKTNKWGMPVLGDMYERMMDACPDSLTYTYVNGDLIGDGFVETLDALFVGDASKLGEFLMVGKRTNVPWSEKYDATSEDFDFGAHIKKGKLFVPHAQDYFTTTKNAIDWKAIPPFVAGRPGYDNWLVEHVHNDRPNVALVDGTNTVHMIHQTDEAGVLSWGGNKAKDEGDTMYNLRYAKEGNPRRRFANGMTYSAEWETMVDKDQGIVVRHKEFKHVW